MINRTSLVTLATLICLFVWFLISAEVKVVSSSNSNEYLRHFDIEFSGIVTAFRPIYYNLGVLHMDQVYSDVDYYDDRSQFGYTCCLISRGKIDLLGAFNNIEKGDSVVVRGATDSVYVFRENEFLFGQKLYVTKGARFKRFEEFIRD